eukprot:COSAG01_NODE_2028_length_8596_cov_9.004590_5_plen_473_part_00
MWAVTGSYGRGDYFGELALLAHQPRQATVSACGPQGASCLRLSQEAFEVVASQCAAVLGHRQQLYTDMEADMRAVMMDSDEEESRPRWASSSSDSMIEGSSSEDEDRSLSGAAEAGSPPRPVWHTQLAQQQQLHGPHETYEYGSSDGDSSDDDGRRSTPVGADRGRRDSASSIESRNSSVVSMELTGDRSVMLSDGAVPASFDSPAGTTAAPLEEDPDEADAANTEVVDTVGSSLVSGLSLMPMRRSGDDDSGFLGEDVGDASPDYSPSAPLDTGAGSPITAGLQEEDPDADVFVSPQLTGTLVDSPMSPLALTPPEDSVSSVETSHGVEVQVGFATELDFDLGESRVFRRPWKCEGAEKSEESEYSTMVAAVHEGQGTAAATGLVEEGQYIVKVSGVSTAGLDASAVRFLIGNDDTRPLMVTFCKWEWRPPPPLSVPGEADVDYDNPAGPPLLPTPGSWLLGALQVRHTAL